GKILGSDASILEVTKPYAKELLKRGYDTRSIVKNLDREARTASGYLRTIPRHFNDILRQTAAGKQRIEVRHGGLEQIQSQIEKGINRLTIGIVIAASIIGGAMILNSGNQIMQFSTTVLGLEGISLTAILGVVGYAVATLLGIWLVVSILRSGRL
ncbi:MAG: AarF/ABC1/UbiB kinase family protein, partial [Syntrophobacteraceae bacterium]